jgi:hypothetical protein
MKPLLQILLLALIGVMPAFPQDTIKVTPDELRIHMNYLAGDQMRGRRNGTPEMKQAAEYIAAYFKEAGLKPAIGDTSWFQEYKITGRTGNEVSERNVLGILEGSDPVLRNEWIIVSAHFDHVGTMKPNGGDSIFNGADDNAAGTITMMTLAKLLNQPGFRPARSVLFAAWSGEEMGLRGSRWFLDHPVIPMDQMKLNMNFEMTGEYKTIGDKKFIITGYLFTDFDDLVEQYNQSSEWHVATQMLSSPGVFFASDNAAFAIKRSADKIELQMPAFTIVTTDAQGLIHKVTDDPSIIEYDNMAAFTNYSAGLIHWLSSNKLDLQWDAEAFNKYLNSR